MADEADGLHTGVWKGCVAHKLRQAFDHVLEGVDSRGKVLLEGVGWVGTSQEGKRERSGPSRLAGGHRTDTGRIERTDDVAGGLEGQLHDGLIVVRGCLVKD